MLSNEISNDFIHLFEEEINKQDLDFENVSSILNVLPKNMHYLCKECLKFPKIKFLTNEKIKLICNCGNKDKEIDIKDIFSYISNSSIEDINNHNIICSEHNEKFAYYCTKCKIHLCINCTEKCDEKEHFLIDLIRDKKTRKKVKNILNQIEDKFRNIKNNEIEDKEENLTFLNDSDSIQLINYQNNCNKIYNKNINKINSANNNTNIDSKEIISLIENTKEDLNEEYFLKFFFIVINDYKNFPNYNHIKNIANIGLFFDYFYGNNNTEIKLSYKIENKNNKLNIFGDKFIKNNQDNFFLIINNIITELNSYINVSKIYNNLELSEIEIKLIQKDKIINDISYMFYDCLSLLSLNNLSNINTHNIINMDYTFYGCSSLISLPDISKWNTSKVENISYMFYRCSLLKYLPEISKWNTAKIKNMSYLFAYCSSLETLPDISIWDTSNVIDMSYMFYYCSSLKVIPNIIKWKMKNSINTTKMFENCSSLKNFPNFHKSEINPFFQNYTNENNNGITNTNLDYIRNCKSLSIICCCFIAIIFILEVINEFFYYIFFTFFAPLYYLNIAFFVKKSELSIENPKLYKDFTKKIIMKIKIYSNNLSLFKFNFNNYIFNIFIFFVLCQIY